MRVVGGYPWMMGGTPVFPLPKIRYPSAKVRVEFPTTGAFWEMTGGWDRWTGGFVTSNTTNMTPAEKASIVWQGTLFPDPPPTISTIDTETEPVTYRIGGSGPFRNGTQTTELLDEESLDEYTTDMDEALADLQTWPTIKIVEDARGTDFLNTFPIARYAVRPGGVGIYRYGMQGEVSSEFPIILPAAMAAIIYNNAGPFDTQLPIYGPLELCGVNLSHGVNVFQAAKVRSGVTKGAEWITRTARWEEFTRGYWSADVEVACNPEVDFPGGIIEPPLWEDVEAVFSQGYTERRCLPPHVWPPPTPGPVLPGVTPSCV